MNQKTNLIPEFDIKPEINMKVLMVIVVKDAIRLPWLPPIMLKGNPRMINDPMIICVHHDESKRN